MIAIANKIEYVTKRDGTRQPWDPLKLIKWSAWAKKNLGERIQWASVVDEVIEQAQDGMKTRTLQNNLINTLLRRADWPHNLMAGCLYAALMQRDFYGAKLPSVQSQMERMEAIGQMSKLYYSKDEWEQIEKIIDHTRDFDLAHFQIKHIVKKYALQDRIKNITYETPQFTYMRMALALCQEDKEGVRIHHLRETYDLLSQNVVNAPTPNYIYLGTPMSGLVSCCLYTTKDTIGSLSVGDHIAYRMTAIGAGIGGMIRTRGMGEGVRNNAIVHNGKLPYYQAQAKSVKANMQSGRAGACTSYYNIFDKEAFQIAQLQNPRTPEQRKNRDIHFAVSYHSVFLKKAALNEDIFIFSTKTAPDLFQAFYGPDKALFERLYNEYEADDNFKKEYVNARDLLVMCERQAYEAGTHYDFFADNANHHTPFKDPIYSSNLCVAGTTKILTSEGEPEIASKVGQKVQVWNGLEWSTVMVYKTGDNQELMEVTTASGKKLQCTPYHKWYVKDGKGFSTETRTSELQVGDRLEDFHLPGSSEWICDEVVSIQRDGLRGDTYCFTEPLRHRGVFNGILTGQCLEIMEPTHGYDDSNQLHQAKYFGTITFKLTCGKIVTLNQDEKLYLADDEQIDAGDLKPGDVYTKTALLDARSFEEASAYTVEKIIAADRQPEVALCSLAGIVVPNIKDDAHYAKAMYYALRMIDYCIHKSDYPFAHIAFTAKKRLNAGVGIVGLATHMARKKVRYDNAAGLAEAHAVAERHMYFAIKASIQLGRERGNAPWINRTKWVDGWLPIDTYSKSIDEVTPAKCQYDWEGLRAELLLQKGMRFSCLVAHMPTESSSKAAGMPNGLYPVRELSMKKSDATNMIDWCAVDSDILKHDYQMAWDVQQESMIDFYGVIQKFTDQGISGDMYADRSKTLDLSATKLIEIPLRMQRRGMKSRYYINTKTDGDDSGTSADAVCGSGACTL